VVKLRGVDDEVKHEETAGFANAPVASLKRKNLEKINIALIATTVNVAMAVKSHTHASRHARACGDVPTEGDDATTTR